MSSRKPFKKCILHIGTEKTGTTAIQQYLRHNRDALAKHGIYHPLAADTEHSSQWEFVAIVHHAPWGQDTGRELGITDKTSQAAFKDSLRDRLDAEFESLESTDTLIISSEHFQSRLYLEREITDLKAFLERWVETFEVLVYFRRQDELALSLLSTRLKSSAQVTLDNILRTLNNTPKYYAYDEIYTRWADVFGSDAMHARVYDPEQWPNDSLVSDFCVAAGLPEFSIVPHRHNRSLNRQGFQFIHALNHLYPNTPGDWKDEKRAELVRRVGKLFAGKYYPLSRHQAISFYRQFDKANERLRAMAFPEHPAPLFSEDFSQYPEEAESLVPDFNDAVEVAVALWNSTPTEKEPDEKPSLRRWLPWLKR
ncbi:MAG: hypothetical protein ACX94D_04160 [Henriciella sp.]